MLENNQVSNLVATIAYHLDLMPQHLPSVLTGFDEGENHPIDPFELKRWVVYIDKRKADADEETLKVVDENLELINKALKDHEEDQDYIKDDEFLVSTYRGMLVGELKPIIFGADYSKHPMRIRDFDVIESILKDAEDRNMDSMPESTLFKTKGFLVALVDKYKPHTLADIRNLFIDEKKPK